MAFRLFTTHAFDKDVKRCKKEAILWKTLP